MALELAMNSSSEAAPTLFERVGGQETFFRLVTRFYEAVAGDEVLRPLYPADLKESAWWTALFLIQYCGGPSDYSAQRGHPRLRMRHLPFSIGLAERDAWLKHMNAACFEEIQDEEARAFLLKYFEQTANFMMNRAQ